MTLPFTLPDWLPPWAFLLLALPVLLFVLAFLLMPFSVFGVKSRLEALETQLDSLHEEIRNLAIRSSGMLGSGPTRVRVEEESFDTLPNFGRLKSSQRAFAESPPPPTPTPSAPPVIPPPLTPMVEPREKPLGAKPSLPPRPPRRMEPRLD